MQPKEARTVVRLLVRVLRVAQVTYFLTLADTDRRTPSLKPFATIGQRMSLHVWMGCCCLYYSRAIYLPSRNKNEETKNKESDSLRNAVVKVYFVTASSRENKRERSMEELRDYCCNWKVKQPWPRMNVNLAYRELLYLYRGKQVKTFLIRKDDD